MEPNTHPGLRTWAPGQLPSSAAHRKTTAQVLDEPFSNKHTGSFEVRWWTLRTHRPALDEEGVEVHEDSSGLFGVGLLVQVSVEVAELQHTHTHIVSDQQHRPHAAPDVSEPMFTMLGSLPERSLHTGVPGGGRSLTSGAGSNWEIT